MKSKKIIFKKSFSYSFMIVTGLSTIASLLGFSIKELFVVPTLWKSILFFLTIFLIVLIIVVLIEIKLNHRGFSTKINGKEIIIKQGNLFKMTGLKLIPFNENFDLRVDDKVISHDSLNGNFIDNYIDDLNDLRKTIKAAEKENVVLSPQKKGNKTIYPLGRIIKYGDFLLLAMTHFDKQNQAYINVHEYEAMLTNMWQEIRRVYAGKKIILPLVGSGITTMTGVQEKDNTMLLKCMLCTLKRSKFSPKNGLIIVLTQETLDSIDIIRIKEEFKDE